VDTFNTNIYSVIFIMFFIMIYLDNYNMNRNEFRNERFVQENLQIYDDDFKKGDQTPDETGYIGISNSDSDKQLSGSKDSYVFHKLPVPVPGYVKSIFLIIDLPPPSLTI
jgi:hypothetical protein